MGPPPRPARNRSDRQAAAKRAKDRYPWQAWKRDTLGHGPREQQTVSELK